MGFLIEFISYIYYTVTRQTLHVHSPDAYTEIISSRSDLKRRSLRFFEEVAQPEQQEEEQQKDE